MNFTQLNLDNLMEHKFLCGDIFWQKKSGKKILISTAGEFLDFNFVQKLLSKNESIGIQENFDRTMIHELEKILIELKNCEVESEKLCVRAKFLNFINLNSKESHLLLTGAMFNTFYEQAKEIEKIYLTNNSELLTRLVSVASITVSEALLSGYLDFKILKDIYNTVLISDVYLAQVKVNLSKVDIFKDEFREHGTKAIDFLDQSLSNAFLINVLELHEKDKEILNNDIIHIRQSSEKLFSMKRTEYIKLTIKDCLKSYSFEEVA